MSDGWRRTPPRSATLRVFLPGATGYIGGVIAKTLQAGGHTVTGLARTDDAAVRLRAAGIGAILGDLADTDVLVRGASESDAVVYAATNDPQKTLHALTALVDALDGTGRPLIFLSGSSVYGDTGATMVDEDAVLSPPASMMQLVAYEKIVRDAATVGVRGVIVRGAGILYGRGGGATPRFLLGDARATGVARYVGDGSQRWSAVHVDDVASLVVAALTEAPAGATYNAAAGNLTLYEAATAVGAAVGVGTASIAPDDARALWGDFWGNLLASSLWVSGERARRDLGWTPAGVPFAQDIGTGEYS